MSLSPRIRKKGGSRSGAAMVEFAFTFPVLFAILAGIWEVGRLVELEQILTTAARQAAREASTGSIQATVTGGYIDTTSAIYADISNFLSNNGVSPTGMTIGFKNLTAPANTGIPSQVPVGANDTTQGDQLQLTVTVIYGNNRWSVTSFFVSPTTPVSATCVFPCCKDLPLQVSSTLPQG